MGLGPRSGAWSVPLARAQASKHWSVPLAPGRVLQGVDNAWVRAQASKHWGGGEAPYYGRGSLAWLGPESLSHAAGYARARIGTHTPPTVFHGSKKSRTKQLSAGPAGHEAS